MLFMVQLFPTLGPVQHILLIQREDESQKILRASYAKIGAINEFCVK